MELEGVYRRIVTVGPKKYCCIKEDGSYDWACNGLPARSNPQTDVLSQFEKVLSGETVSLDYFSINTTSEFGLCHTTNATKKLRFLSLKGAVEDGAIRWWKDERGFVEYASGVTPVGWERMTPKRQKEALKRLPSSDFDQDSSSNTASDEMQLENVHIKEWRKDEKPIGKSDTCHYVYVLTDIEENGFSYVGYTNDLENRLNKHNGGVGAMATAGTQWKYYKIYAGFVDKKHALRFESLLHLHSVDTVFDWCNVADNAIKTYSEFANVALVDFTP